MPGRTTSGDSRWCGDFLPTWRGRQGALSSTTGGRLVRRGPQPVHTKTSRRSQLSEPRCSQLQNGPRNNLSTGLTEGQSNFSMCFSRGICLCMCLLTDGWCICLAAQSCLTLCDPMDCSPPGSSMGFFRQEYWTGLPFPSPGHLPDPKIKP